MATWSDITLYFLAVFTVIYLISVFVSYYLSSLIFEEYDNPVDPPDPDNKFNRPYGKHVIPIRNACTTVDTRNWFARYFNPPSPSDIVILNSAGATVAPPSRIASSTDPFYTTCKAECTQNPKVPKGNPTPVIDPATKLVIHPCLDKNGNDILLPPPST